MRKINWLINLLLMLALYPVPTHAQDLTVHNVVSHEKIMAAMAQQPIFDLPCPTGYTSIQQTTNPQNGHIKAWACANNTNGTVIVQSGGGPVGTCPTGAAGNVLYTDGVNCLGIPNSNANPLGFGDVNFFGNFLSQGGSVISIAGHESGTATGLSLKGQTINVQNETTDAMASVNGLTVIANADDGGGTAALVEGIHVNDISGGTTNYAIRTGKGIVAFGPGPDIDPMGGAGEIADILNENLTAPQIQGLHINTQNGATGSGNDAAAFAAFDTGTNNIQGLSAIQSLTEHASSGTIDELIGGVESSAATDMGSGPATLVEHFLVDSPIFNSTVAQIHGFHVQDLCGIGSGTVAATACDALHINAQTSPGKAIVVDGGNSSFAGLVQTTAVAFSTLATCVNGLEGSMRAVLDSTTNTWGATITGSGADHVLAYCDGTNWTVAAK